MAEKLSKEEILERLRDPDLSSEEKAELMEMLYEGIDIKMQEQKTIHEKWADGEITILPPKKDDGVTEDTGS